MHSRRPAVIFFILLTAIYVALSPLSVKSMGYTSEQVDASRGLLRTLARAFHGELTTGEMRWPRHGLVEPIIELPLLWLGEIAFGASSPGEDLVLSLQPLLFSALLCTILFIWVQEITGSTSRARLLGLAAGLTTMIWPYAYIGLETTQSVCLLLAAYLALGASRFSAPVRTAGFALAAAVAVSVKANGLLLVPAVAWLVASLWKRRGFSGGLGLTIVVIAAAFVLNEYWRGFAAWRGSGTAALVGAFRVDGATAFLNTLYVLVAPNKGFLVYCPVVLLALAALPRAYREDPAVVIFAVLAFAGLTFGSALVVFWADDTWGPRYLHSAVAPLVVCLALATRGAPQQIRRNLPLLAAMLAGFIVSGLGVLFYYWTASLAATAAGQRSLEDIQHDPAWNPIRLHGALMMVWLKGPDAGPTPWPPERHRWYPNPGESFKHQPAAVIDLRSFAKPQPYVLRRIVIP